MKFDFKAFFKRLFSITKVFNQAAQPKTPSQRMVDKFVFAAGVGDEKAVQKFLDKYGREYVDAVGNADPFKVAPTSTTALIEAALGGHEPIVKLLLDNGANVLKQDDIGYTARAWAQTRTRKEKAPNAWTRIAKQLEDLEVALRLNRVEAPKA